MTSKQLWDIIDDYVLRNLGRVVSNFLDGKIIPKPQDSTHATWVPKRNLDDCFVDFSMSLDRMDAFFRALVSPYPLPRIRIRGQTYEILQAEVIGREYFCSIGRVVAHHKSSALIKFSGGLLAVNKLSDLATGGIVPAQSILRVGERL